jgi:hypothetical protein
VRERPAVVQQRLHVPWLDPVLLITNRGQRKRWRGRTRGLSSPFADSGGSRRAYSQNCATATRIPPPYPQYPGPECTWLPLSVLQSVDRWAPERCLTPDCHPAVLASLLKRETRPHWPKRTTLREKEIPASRTPRPVDAVPRKGVYAHGQSGRNDVGPPAGFLECPNQSQDGKQGQRQAEPVCSPPQDDPLESLELSFSGLHLAPPRVSPTNLRSLVDFFKRHGRFSSRWWRS